MIETEPVENYAITTYHKVIRIELKAKDDTLQLSVSDTSIGVGAEIYLVCLNLEPTYVKGAGLRLSVSLAEAHGGVLSVESARWEKEQHSLSQSPDLKGGTGLW